MSEEVLEVRNAPHESRYTVSVDGKPAGFAAYRREAGRVVFTHTEVAEGYAGQGVGSALVAGALDDVRSDGRSVVAQCPFVAQFIASHADYADLLDDRPR